MYVFISVCMYLYLKYWKRQIHAHTYNTYTYRHMPFGVYICTHMHMLYKYIFDPHKHAIYAMLCMQFSILVKTHMHTQVHLCQCYWAISSWLPVAVWPAGSVHTAACSAAQWHRARASPTGRALSCGPARPWGTRDSESGKR